MLNLRLLALGLASSLALGVGAYSEAQTVLATASQREGLRVAIIGAGAAGSFTAYSLKFLEDALQVPQGSRITLFERERYIGGRSTIVEIPHTAAYAELGASIFVEANRNMMHAVKIFNLSLQDGHGEGTEISRRLAIYNGEEFVYEQTGYAFGFWDTAKILWRYRTSPLKVRGLMKKLLATFVTSYAGPIHSKGPFRTIEGWAASLEGFEQLYHSYSHAHLRSEGVSDAFIDDFVSAGTTVNYAQTPQSMHALEGIVSVAAEGASSVVGGNRQIFERFAKASGSEVLLNTTVKSVAKINSDNQIGWRIEYADGDGNVKHANYDVLVIAAPLHQTGIRFEGSDAPSRALNTEYISLHVTLIVTNASAPQACFFGPQWSCDQLAPRTVLTTLAYWESGKVKKQPRVNSLNYLRDLGDGKWLVKLFSMRPLVTSDVEQAFGVTNVLWIHRKQWFSYPKLPPVDKFSPIQLDERFYDASAMEPCISTMETQTISAWNIARLIMFDVHNIKVDRSWPEWNHGDDARDGL